MRWVIVRNQDTLVLLAVSESRVVIDAPELVLPRLEFHAMNLLKGPALAELVPVSSKGRHCNTLCNAVTEALGAPTGWPAHRYFYGQ